MRDEKGKITIKSLWKYYRTDKGKKMSFWLFYLIFFIFVFIYIAIGNNTNTNENNNTNDNNDNFMFKTTYIEENDYNFTYTKTPEKMVLNGTKNEDNITLEDKNGNNYNYLYIGGKLVYRDDIKNPITYMEFIDIYELKRIIKNATYNHKTEYKNGEVLYNYTISSNKLKDYIESNMTFNSELENEIVILTDKNNQVYKITIDLTNWIKNNYIDTEIGDYVIEIMYLFGDNNE